MAKNSVRALKISDELRLMLCGWCFTIVLYLAPDNPEGFRIIKTIRDWAGREISLRGQTKPRENAEWTFQDCPKCGLPFIARDKFGLFCAAGNCDWEEDKIKDKKYVNNKN